MNGFEIVEDLLISVVRVGIDDFDIAFVSDFDIAFVSPIDCMLVVLSISDLFAKSMLSL